jgi:hypothetical protein
MTSGYAYTAVLSKDMSENEGKYNIKAIPGVSDCSSFGPKKRDFPLEGRLFVFLSFSQNLGGAR